MPVKFCWLPANAEIEAPEVLKYSIPVVQKSKVVFILPPPKLNTVAPLASCIYELNFKAPSLPKPPTTEDPFKILKTLSDPASPMSLFA